EPLPEPSSVSLPPVSAEMGGRETDDGSGKGSLARSPDPEHYLLPTEVRRGDNHAVRIVRQAGYFLGRRNVFFGLRVLPRQPRVPRFRALERAELAKSPV
ncbi:Hypothetical predicted protein, partial [Olea europaea subsp. europaea]